MKWTSVLLDNCRSHHGCEPVLVWNYDVLWNSTQIATIVLRDLLTKDQRFPNAEQFLGSRPYQGTL